MSTNVTQMKSRDDMRPRVALIAHDACKDEMAQWAMFNRGTLLTLQPVRHGNDGQACCR
jgi:methylglyoxal synthase